MLWFKVKCLGVRLTKVGVVIVFIINMTEFKITMKSVCVCVCVFIHLFPRKLTKEGRVNLSVDAIISVVVPQTEQRVGNK